jgi:divalent metal cation (Fe/Co/Zn/Cd) transporter
VLDPQDVRQAVGDVPGVYDVTRIRSRGTEDDVYLDLAVNVAPPTTVDDSAAIAEEIRARLRARFEGLADIDVDFVPAADRPLDYARIAHAEGAALGLGAHEVVAAELGGGLMLDMHVEVPSHLTLDEAHHLVSRFEQRMIDILPAVDYVVTHIEPAYGVKAYGDRDERGHALAQQTLRIAMQYFPDNQWHDLNVRAEADGTYSLSLHCRIDGSRPVEEAHRLAEAVETRLRSELPGLGRITIHTEPIQVPTSGGVRMGEIEG